MGKKSSTSQLVQETTNVDGRVVADSGGLGLSGNNNSVTISNTDSGLVSAAFDYLGQADAAITDRNNSTLTVAGNTAKMVIDAGMKAGSDAVMAATNTLSTIERAKSGEGKLDSSQIMAALIGAVALFAVKA